ncbi:MAG: GspH/FimT family protein [Pseudomonadota bacterium]
MSARAGPGWGFSLIELLVAMAVAAVLLAAGLPDLGAMIARQRLRTTANDLFAAIELTRSQAITRGRRVMMAPLDPAGRDWLQGWAVFVDRNGDGRPDQEDDWIFTRGAVAPGITIRSGFVPLSAPFYIAYNGAGRSCSAINNQAARPGTLSLFAGQSARHITINMLGRARMCDPARHAKTCSGPAGP